MRPGHAAAKIAVRIPPRRGCEAATWKERPCQAMAWKERPVQSKAEMERAAGWIPACKHKQTTSSILSTKCDPNAFSLLIRCHLSTRRRLPSRTRVVAAHSKVQQISSQMGARKPCRLIGGSSQRIEFTQNLQFAPRSISIRVQDRPAESVQYGCGR